MRGDDVVLTWRGEVALVTWQPASSAGMVAEESLQQLEAIADEIERTEAAIAGVLVHLGPHAVERAEGLPVTPELDLLRRWEKFLHRVEELQVPTIVVIECDCRRALFQFALACDYRLCSSQVEFQLPEVTDGVLPGTSMMRLVQLSGLGVARRVVIGGRPFSARRAEHWGVVEELFRAGDGARTVDRSVDRLATKSRALRMACRLLREAPQTRLEERIGHVLAAQYLAGNG